ncbi:MAG: membrane protein insertase YidC, partial [Stellaceae bacterium]
MEQQRNLIIAVVISIAILIGFEYFVAPKVKPTAHPPAQTQGQANQPVAGKTGAAPAAPSNVAAPAPVTRDAALGKSARLKISTPRLVGSIDLTGARLDDLTLTNYRETTAPDSPLVQLLSPDSTADPYFADFGWVASDPSVKTPDAASAWQTADKSLGVDHPVTLTWDNGQGLRFTRKIAVDADYMFTVTQAVENHGSKPVTLFPYARIDRGGKTPVQSNRLLHVGPLGVLDGTLHELSYSDLAADKPTEIKTTGGWFGLTDEYWLAALIPDQAEPVETRFTKVARPQGDLYQVDFTGNAHAVAPGGTATTSDRIFAGAKEVHLLDSYEGDLHIPRFDRAIDFGWFYFLTKPIFLILDVFYRHIGNFGLAILLFTLFVKILFFPLANRSYRSMSKMKLLQPEMAKLKERLGNDKERLNQEMMALYKRSGANPAAGCLPIVIQIPVFFSLYKVLSVTIEMRQAPFYGWIHDLSVPDPTTVLNLFGLLPWTVPPHLPLISFLSIGAWPLIMGITMFLQQKMTPYSPDPTQTKMMLALPVVFTFLLANFPAGLVVYWAWN